MFHALNPKAPKVNGNSLLELIVLLTEAEDVIEYGKRAVDVAYIKSEAFGIQKSRGELMEAYFQHRKVAERIVGILALTLTLTLTVIGSGGEDRGDTDIMGLHHFNSLILTGGSHGGARHGMQNTGPMVHSSRPKALVTGTASRSSLSLILRN